MNNAPTPPWPSPTPPAEMYGWGLTVNTGGDATGFVEGVMQNWGGHYTNEDVTEVTFNSPETLAAVEWLTKIYTSPDYASMLPPGLMSWNDSSNNEAFLASQVAYTHNAASVYAKAKADGNPVFEDTVVLENCHGADQHQSWKAVVVASSSSRAAPPTRTCLRNWRST